MEGEVDFPFLIPGTTDPAITIRRTFLGDLRVLANGIPVKRRRQVFAIPLADGTSAELRLSGQWTGLKAVVNGVETRLEPPVPRLLVGLIFLPLGLVLLGGLIGGLIGAVTSGVNLGISRGTMRRPVQVMLMVGATALATAVWFAIAFTLSPVPTLATGTCTNGIREGEQPASAYRPVDCALSHDNEVVGTVTYPEGGAYPGQDVLFAFGQRPCSEAFASYVGIDFQSSVLNMIILTPSDLTWVKGDRAISCVALQASGKITGSIRGAAR